MDTGTVNLYAAHLESTPYGQVFQKIIRKDGFAKNIIENYNNEVINKIPQIILNTTIPTQKGIIQFRNVQMFKPTIEERSKVEDLYPRISHDKGIPYFATLKFEMIHKKLTGNVFGQATYASEPDDVHATEPLKCIPVMLGSDLCHLNGKSAEEKMALGECFNDIFGYFISKSERVIINQENLRLSTFMIYVPDAVKGLIEGRITCPTTQGTTVTSITITKTKALAVSLQHLRKKPKKPILLPIFEVFKILGMDVQEAMDLILSFIPEQFREAAIYILQSSISEYGNEISNGDDSVEALITNIYNRRMNDDKMVKRENVIRDIERDLFSNVKNVQNKLMHLAMYSSRMIEVLVESRKLDDRDSWANKRVATPGRSIYQLFKGIWANLINRTIAKTIDAKNLKDVVGKVNFTEIRDNFITAFGSAGWGVKGSYSKENIVDSLKRTTPLELYSQIGRLSTPTSRQSKNPVIRMPHGSQNGYFCLYETPDGEGVGLVKNFASSLYVSLERDPESIVQILNSKELASYFTTERKHEELTPVTVNGVIEGWCVPEGLVISLKYYKSLGIINKDVCIFHNKRDRCVEIFCDGGRPTRPLFVVDRDNQLMIDKLNMWHSNIDELVKAGCIEYLDAREQEWVYLAQDVNTVREFRENKIRMEKLSGKKTLSEEESVEFEILQLKIAQGVPQYTHSEIDPVAMFSLAANLVPQANRQAGPRTQYQANMSRQALTQYHSNEHLRFDAVYKMMYYPCKPIFQNDLQETAGLNLMPNGQTLQVAIMALPDNPEDGIVFKEEAIKYNNKFDLCKKSLTVSDISRSKDSTYEELFAKPPIKPGEPESRYSAIGDDGIPILDAYIRPGDCIIGKIRKFNKSTDTSVAGKVVNLSQFAGVGEEGYVDRVLITKTGNGDKIIKVKLRHNRKYIPGDKIACVTKDHEVLTSNRGWVNITDITLSDEVATLAPNHEIQYHKPSALHHSCYTGTMYGIENDLIDTVLTPTHRVYYSRDMSSWGFDTVANVSKLGIVYFATRDGMIRLFRNQFRKFEFEGSVHCLTVKNEIFLTRRNGKMYWTGNSRYSQKGTIAKVVSARYLPRVASGPLKGMVPDIFINPHGQPSRMTMNMMIEILVTKAALISGRYINSTTFREFDDEIKSAQKTLEEYGLDPNGKEEFELPNGKKLKNRVYFGPCFYQALKHHVTDKISMRARKGVKPSTRQPLGGRSLEGGLKVGEMERDALISHGASALLRERLCDVSDAFNLPICKKCGTIAITNHRLGIYKCNLCGDKAEIGLIRIPYVVKLLLFYLNAAGIHMTFKVNEIISPNGRPEEKFLM